VNNVPECFDKLPVKDVLLISPYFVPSNLAGVHRVRLMSGGLEAHGWSPTILAVDPSCYEEPSDRALLHLMPPGVRVEHVSAWPARFCRPLGFGDIALRGQWTLRRRVAELVGTRKPSVIFATVLPGYTSMVGAWAKRRFNIPFVLDYQDPWVPKGDRKSHGSIKRNLADKIARWLEPKAIRVADAITAVSEETLDSLRERDLIRSDQLVEIVPVGADRNDHAAAQRYGNSVIEPSADIVQIAYVGTLTERMLPALTAFLSAAAQAQSGAARNFVIHLIGTSAQPEGHDQHNLAALVGKVGLSGKVFLHPARIGYLDALRTMQEADLLLLLGSTDSHYTASKLFPYWLIGKPILGLFHRNSTVVNVSRDLGGIRLALFDDERGPETAIGEVAALITKLMAGETITPVRNEAAFQPYSSEGVASRYAQLFDRVAAKCA
jgi:glycosyltransferase involved in cell wall biosynthesis